MPTIEQTIRIYQELADAEEKHGAPQARDRFLILAADAALSAGRPEEAERLRSRLLQLSPHHMLKPYRSLADALQSPDVRNYLAELRNSSPPAKAEAQLLALRDPQGTKPSATAEPATPPPERTAKPSTAAT